MATIHVEPKPLAFIPEAQPEQVAPHADAIRAAVHEAIDNIGGAALDVATRLRTAELLYLPDPDGEVDSDGWSEQLWPLKQALAMAGVLEAVEQGAQYEERVQLAGEKHRMLEGECAFDSRTADQLVFLLRALADAIPEDAPQAAAALYAFVRKVNTSLLSTYGWQLDYAATNVEVQG